MITTIIVDDEVNNQKVLHTLLLKYCPEITCVATADSAIMAYELIKTHKPQLVFLDIKMPVESGFDLLRRFDNINFDVIFVSAFNEYAVSAFEFSAIGYILKPIDYEKLQRAVERAVRKIKASDNEGNVDLFLKSLESESDNTHKVPVHHNGKVIYIHFDDIAYLKAISDRTEVNLKTNKKYISNRSIKQFEEVMVHLPHFIRINKSTLINSHYISAYTKGDYCTLTLENGHEFEVSRRKKSEVLSKLRSV